MITEQDLRSAIAECEGARNPTASTCLKLAAFYTILNQMQGTSQTPVIRGYSFASEQDPKIQYGDSEFSQLVEQKGIDRCYPVIDELMNVLFVVNKSLYDNVIRKLKGL